jgi:hypothetical protein
VKSTYDSQPSAFPANDFSNSRSSLATTTTINQQPTTTTATTTTTTTPQFLSTPQLGGDLRNPVQLLLCSTALGIQPHRRLSASNRGGDLTSTIPSATHPRSKTIQLVSRRRLNDYDSKLPWQRHRAIDCPVATAALTTLGWALRRRAQTFALPQRNSGTSNSMTSL